MSRLRINRAALVLVAAATVSMTMVACSIAPAATSMGSPTAVEPASAPTVAPTETPTASLTAAPALSPTSSSPPSASPSLIAAASPALPHADPDLEAFLPASLAGTALTRFSTPGSTFAGGSDMCILICGDEPYRYAKELGIPIDDVTIAFAVDDRLGIGMIVYRARGAPVERLIPARIAIGGYSGQADLPGRPVRVAGRPATYLDLAFGASGEYLMTRHGVLFIVLGVAPDTDGTVPAHVTEAFGGID